MTEEYIRATDKMDRIEELLSELIEEVRSQGELNRINNTILARRMLKKDSESPVPSE